MNIPEFIVTLQNRVALVEDLVAAACRRAGRQRSEVTIVAVTKTLSLEETRLVLDAGLVHLGENRPQELWRKAPAIPEATWHFIGHLQRNKIDKTLPAASLLHSIDSIRLLRALDEEAGKQKRIVPLLLEVNASGESAKQGFAPEALLELAPELTAVKNVQVRGLMTMAAPLANSEECRPTFATLRELRNRLRERIAPDHPCDHLSMGMSNDFAVAIEEGATLIRLGTIYFQGLKL